MNIAEAKEQIKDTVEAYLAKDGDGYPYIPTAQQRPIFLLGAPGIGKTAIMEQISEEMGIGLVSYSMTHHTRQSALGLPFIVQESFEGLEYQASEYTMSEIISSIYDYMRKTGVRKGILFLDEINCVSETLYPSMLQFLQMKTFGRHAVPQDWIVVCAGNPPEYNRSVHEFDIVTLDRLRKVEVEPDYDAWRAYAQNVGVHPAILTFLEIDKERFYLVESKPGEKSFVTARGWNDLSRVIALFERLGKTVDLNLIEQFLQNDEIAEEFARYYALFSKYRSSYQVGAILAGEAPEEVQARAQRAAFDERLALVDMMEDELCADMADAVQEMGVLTDVRDYLRSLKERADDAGFLQESFEREVKHRRALVGTVKRAGKGELAGARLQAKELALVTELDAIRRAAPEGEGFAAMTEAFGARAGRFQEQVEGVRGKLAHAFAFLDEAFGADARETIVFVGDLTAREASMRFVSKCGSEEFYAHNSTLMTDRNEQELFDRIDASGLV